MNIKALVYVYLFNVQYEFQWRNFFRALVHATTSTCVAQVCLRDFMQLQFNSLIVSRNQLLDVELSSFHYLYSSLNVHFVSN